MLGRCLPLLFIPVLPWVPFMAPFGRAHSAKAIIAGIIASDDHQLPLAAS